MLLALGPSITLSSSPSTIRPQATCVTDTSGPQQTHPLHDTCIVTHVICVVSIGTWIKYLQIIFLQALPVQSGCRSRGLTTVMHFENYFLSILNYPSWIFMSKKVEHKVDATLCNKTGFLLCSVFYTLVHHFVIFMKYLYLICFPKFY